MLLLADTFDSCVVFCCNLLLCQTINTSLIAACIAVRALTDFALGGLDPARGKLVTMENSIIFIKSWMLYIFKYCMGQAPF